MRRALTRRAVLAGGLAGLAAAPALGSGDPFAPSAATLARPAAPPRDLSGLAIHDGLGREVPLSVFAGVTIVLNFWAPWCLPCRREMPSLSALAERLEGTRMQVVPVGFDMRGPAGVVRFYKDLGVDNLPILLGDPDNYSSVLGTDVLPTTLVIDPTGTERATVTGEARWDDNPTLAWLAGIGR